MIDAFKDVKIGDKFKCVDGSIALFVSTNHPFYYFVIENGMSIVTYDDDGVPCMCNGWSDEDVWFKSIHSKCDCVLDEDALLRAANEYVRKSGNNDCTIDSFVAGYKFAKSKQQ